MPNHVFCLLCTGVSLSLIGLPAPAPVLKEESVVTRKKAEAVAQASVAGGSTTSRLTSVDGTAALSLAAGASM